MCTGTDHEGNSSSRRASFSESEKKPEGRKTLEWKDDPLWFVRCVVLWRDTSGRVQGDSEGAQLPHNIASASVLSFGSRTIQGNDGGVVKPGKQGAGKQELATQHLAKPLTRKAVATAAAVPSLHDDTCARTHPSPLTRRSKEQGKSKEEETAELQRRRALEKQRKVLEKMVKGRPYLEEVLTPHKARGMPFPLASVGCRLRSSFCGGSHLSAALMLITGSYNSFHHPEKY